MNSKTRALIALVLTLALPLRVYAAVAMEFCTAASHASERAAATDASVEEHQQHHHAASRPDHTGGHDTAHPEQGLHSDTCLSCCCAALIAGAPLQFDLLPSPAPQAPPFTRVAIVSFVPDGLDRPPQALLA